MKIVLNSFNKVIENKCKNNKLNIPVFQLAIL